MDKVTILFGAGENGKRVLEQMQTNFSIRGGVLFCDNYVTSIINGIRTIDFNELMQLYEVNKIEKIILTLFDDREVLHQCLSAGINISDLYYCDEESHMLRSIKEKYALTIHSCDGEEVFLRQLFGKKDKGVYIDIGANHPFRFSNTWWAYSRGWRGINIEPDVINYELLQNIREDDININCGISNEEGKLTYYMFKESAANTFCAEEIETGRKTGVINSCNVPVRRLDTILQEYDVWKIDFVDIDVEGMELEVLESISWNKVNITCILVEQRNMNLQEVLESKVYEFLKDKGYMPVSKYNRTVIYLKDRDM